MLHALDLRSTDPRSAHDMLGGVKLLARIVDKGLASIFGMLGPYQFFDCTLDRVFFDALNISRDEFIEMLRQSFTSRFSDNSVALADLREALASEPEVSDEYFMEYAAERDADNAVVRWLLVQRRTPLSVLAAINDAVDCLPPEAFNDRADE